MRMNVSPASVLRNKRALFPLPVVPISTTSDCGRVDQTGRHDVAASPGRAVECGPIRAHVSPKSSAATTVHRRAARRQSPNCSGAARVNGVGIEQADATLRNPRAIRADRPRVPNPASRRSRPSCAQMPRWKPQWNATLCAGAEWRCSQWLPSRCRSSCRDGPCDLARSSPAEHFKSTARSMRDSTLQFSTAAARPPREDSLPLLGVRGARL